MIVGDINFSRTYFEKEHTASNSQLNRREQSMIEIIPTIIDIITKAHTHPEVQKRYTYIQAKQLKINILPIVRSLNISDDIIVKWQIKFLF
ncbi:unnamed protein product [Rotaria sordida]|uniref:Uncharacterized protein n=1 Tax=Rotaria sordida TaxID=392033 RepID=A0A815MCJ9_9BILA|nr:unnamed protein product [Rotaria sordida]CAF4191171.1 unnamed protein product [Rotaria sordida]